MYELPVSSEEYRMQEEKRKEVLRRTERRQIDKWMLLKILQQEELLPADATHIIATGHDQDYLIVTVAFD